MPISILCPGCKKTLRASDDSAGRKVKCPHCGIAMEIRRPSATGATIPPVISSRRPEKRPQHLLVRLSLGLGAVIAAIVVLILIASMFTRQRNDQGAGIEPPAKSKTRTQTTDAPAKFSTKGEKENTLVEAKQNEEKPTQEKEKTEQPGAGNGTKRIQDLISTAIALQAPPLEKGKYADAGEFGKMMRNLVANEFVFREAQNQIYRSTFNQKQLEYSALLKTFHARNAVAVPGKYDFGRGYYFFDLIFWQALYEEKRLQEGPVNPRTDDVCKLQTAIKLDAKTAQRWREAIDKGTFSVTVWYRMTKIERGVWQQNPHWNPVPMPAHDIAIDVEILKFEEDSSEVETMPNSGSAGAKPKTLPEPTAIAIVRQTADSYITSVENRGLLRRAVFAGIYKNPKGDDSFAVCYTVSEVNRKPVVSQLVHVFVFKDNGGQWRISAFSQDGIHVALGHPPNGFTKVSYSTD